MLKKKNRLLWSGGLRSTYRLIELCRQPNVKIQPVTIAFTKEQSTPYEIQAQSNILAWLLSRKLPVAHLMPPTYLTENQVQVSPQLRQEFDAFMRTEPELANPRWLILAAYAEKARKIDFCGLIPETAVCGNDTPSLFGNYSLQCEGVSDAEMLEHLSSWGYGELVSLLWSCDRPYHGEPCGVCPNCVRKIKAGSAAYHQSSVQKRYSMLMSLTDCGKHEEAEMFKAYIHGELNAVLTMYVNLENAMMFEKTVLPEETERIAEKIRHIKELLGEYRQEFPEQV